jgi:hypothetical protein
MSFPGFRLLIALASRGEEAKRSRRRAPCTHHTRVQRATALALQQRRSTIQQELAAHENQRIRSGGTAAEAARRPSTGHPYRTILEGIAAQERREKKVQSKHDRG